MLISLSFGETSRNLQSLMATLWISSQGPVGEIVGSVRIDLFLGGHLGARSIIGMGIRGVCCLVNRPGDQNVGR
jgi:hypothetical protein